MEPEELEAEDSLESSELNESQSESNEQIESPESKEISLEALILRLLKTYTRQRLMPHQVPIIMGRGMITISHFRLLLSKVEIIQLLAPMQFAKL